MYKRERIITPDNDFLDLDWCHSVLYGKSGQLVIISHGLEGDSNRQYVKGMVKICQQSGIDALAWNFRSCGPEMNKNLRFYHSGATDDLDTVVKHAIKNGYKAIFLIGFSIGGNLTLKYLGENKALSEIKKAVVFSVPMHLSGGSKEISKTENWFYNKRFLISLTKKIKVKSKHFPLELNLANLGKIKTIKDFDDEYTSKLHGFINAEDYYAKNSSIIFVENIEVPTLIINALNDPFLSKECYPNIDLNKNPIIQYEYPVEGGHCGFYQNEYNGALWSELRAMDFIKK